MHQQGSSFPGELANILTNATIRHCSRLAGRDCVELSDTAMDGPGKCRGIPRGTRLSDEAYSGASFLSIESAHRNGRRRLAQVIKQLNSRCSAKQAAST